MLKVQFKRQLSCTSTFLTAAVPLTSRLKMNAFNYVAAQRHDTRFQNAVVALNTKYYRIKKCQSTNPVMGVLES